MKHIVKEIQTKSAIRYHCVYNRMLIIQKTDDKDVKKTSPFAGGNIK